MASRDKLFTQVAPIISFSAFHQYPPTLTAWPREMLWVVHNLRLVEIWDLLSFWYLKPWHPHEEVQASLLSRPSQASLGWEATWRRDEPSQLEDFRPTSLPATGLGSEAFSSVDHGTWDCPTEINWAIPQGTPSWPQNCELNKMVAVLSYFILGKFIMQHKLTYTYQCPSINNSNKILNMPINLNRPISYLPYEWT